MGLETTKDQGFIMERDRLMEKITKKATVTAEVGKTTILVSTDEYLGMGVGIQLLRDGNLFATWDVSREEARALWEALGVVVR
jgi:hypothetical protein